MTEDQETTDQTDRSPFGRAWREFVATTKVSDLPPNERAMVRRGFVYGWRAREIADERAEQAALDHAQYQYTVST